VVHFDTGIETVGGIGTVELIVVGRRLREIGMTWTSRRCHP
jgi:hypothetical protein